MRRTRDLQKNISRALEKLKPQKLKHFSTGFFISCMSIYRHMDCPICQNKLITANSRKTAGGASTWRRKYCPNCEKTFTSRESIDLSDIIKIDNLPYSRNQLTAKLAKLSSKSSEEDLISIVETLESRLLKLSRHGHKVTDHIFRSEITTVLEKLDRSAALRFRAEIEEAG